MLKPSPPEEHVPLRLAADAPPLKMKLPEQLDRASPRARAHSLRRSRRQARCPPTVSDLTPPRSRRERQHQIPPPLHPVRARIDRRQLRHLHALAVLHHKTLRRQHVARPVDRDRQDATPSSSAIRNPPLLNVRVDPSGCASPPARSTRASRRSASSALAQALHRLVAIAPIDPMNPAARIARPHTGTLNSSVLATIRSAARAPNGRAPGCRRGSGGSTSRSKARCRRPRARAREPRARRCASAAASGTTTPAAPRTLATEGGPNAASTTVGTLIRAVSTNPMNV